LLLVFCAAASFAADSPDAREITDPKSMLSEPVKDAVPIPIDDLFYTRSLRGGVWSPNGKQIVFTTNITGRYNLWKVSSEGGWPIQLSQSDEAQTAAAWSPDGKWITFEADRSGNEMYDVYAIPSDGGAVVNLTNTPEISETSATWSPDGKSLRIRYKPKTSPSTDIALLDWSTHAVHNLTNEESPDHLAIVLPHGGPTGQTRDNFTRGIITLVTHGYVCIAPNVRGSTGYDSTRLRRSLDHSHTGTSRVVS
jgi:dipeptidyl aminopeptidase/acylaminoacyl peptidase